MHRHALTLTGALALALCACTVPGGGPGAPRIRTALGSFDPAVGPGPALAGLRTVRVGPTAPYLVQLEGPVTLAEREALVDAGATVVAYQPDDAFVVRATPPVAAALSAAPGVRAVLPQSPALRLQPALLVRVGRRLAPSPSMVPTRLLVEVPGEDAQLAVAQAARSMGGTVDSVSAGGHYLKVTLPLAAAPELAARSDVTWVQRADPFHVMNDEARWVIQAGSGAANVGLTPVWDQGLTGQGQLVGIADSGIAGSGSGTTFSSTSCFFADVANKVAYYEVLSGATSGDEIGHGTHTACSIAGNTKNTSFSQYDGQAKDAQLYFQDVANKQDAQKGTLSALPANLATGLFPNPYAYGARIHSDSWGGTTSDYDARARQVDQFVAAHPDFLVLFANGNAGPAAGTVGSPATAKDIISVGATDNATAALPTRPDYMANAYLVSFSSRGPTADGRIKPTLTAPGAMVSSADYQSACGVVAEAGTSMATPTLAGGATLARQYFLEGFYPSGAKTAADALQPSAALLKAVLIAGADPMDGPNAGDIPSMAQGFGRVDVGHALYFAGDAAGDRLWIHDDATGVATGGAPSFTLTTDRDGPLKVALTWTDPAGAAGANPALVDDLDLTVTAPDGTVYKGNVMSGGVSQTGGTADSLNVEELFYLPAAVAGTWVLTVHGTNVPSGPQTFALAAVGEVVVPGQGAPTSDPPAPPPPPAPPAKCTDATVSPVKTAVGWVDSTNTTGNAFGDDDVYAATSGDPNGGFGDRYGVIQVPIRVPSGKTLDHLTLTVTGQTAEFVLAGTSWTFDAVSLPAVSTTTTYTDLKGASVLDTAPQTVQDIQVGRKVENVVTFTPAALGPGGLLTIRIHGNGTASSMMSWDSGYPTTASTGDTTPGLGIPPVVGLCFTVPLTMNPIPAQTVNENAPLTVTPSLSSDPKIAAPVWRATGLPTGASLDPATGVITWTPSYSQAGSYPVTLTVTEGSQTDSQTFTITVNNVNRPPVLAAIPAQSVIVGQALTFTVSATDPDGDKVAITDSGAPAASTFDGTTFAWTPAAADVGPHSVTFTASDGSLTDTGTASITVVAALKLAAIGNQTVNENAPLTVTPTLASDPGTAAPAYGATGLPTGASLDPATGVLTWTPTYSQAGTYPVTLTVTESGQTDSQTFTITVVNVDRPPVLAAIPAQSVTVGQTLTFPVSATDPDGDAVTLTATGLPTGATFDGTSFTWAPAAADAGVHTVTFVASDGTLQSHETVDITVTGAPTPDGGTVTDGGPAPDGGTVTDGGPAPDGGTVTDGGPTPDGGTVTDGGTTPDGGGQPGGTDAGSGGGDAGTGGTAAAGGCSCSATSGSPGGLVPGVLGLLGLVALRRRRARGH